MQNDTGKISASERHPSRAEGHGELHGRASLHIRRTNHGTPGGYFLSWNGRTDWCQPYEFLEWHKLILAVRRRCAIAKLEAVSFACRIPPLERGLRNQIYDLLVLVRRKMNTEKLKLKFLAATNLARLYEDTQSQAQQWVPKSVCTKIEKPSEAETRGDMHDVTISNWWLRSNPFKAKAGDQSSLL